MTTGETTNPRAISLAPRRPARPPWRDLPLLLRTFRADVLEGLRLTHERYGAFVRTRLPLELYFVADPACIEEILLKKAEFFGKGHTSRVLSRVVGDGLLVSEGEPWRRQRRLMQPAFHHQQLQAYAQLMIDEIERAVASWQSGQVRDVHEDMMGVTMKIVSATLFGTDVPADAAEVGEVIARLMEEFARILGLPGRLLPPAWAPTPGNRRLRALVREINQVMLRMIDARRAQDSTRDDLLSLLIRARDEDGGSMTDAQVRTEVLTLFLAGHETTALTLSYALFLLAAHPECQARLVDELDRILGARSPSLADLDALAYTDAIVLESMRLYPPGWALTRQALTAIEVGGFRFPKGAEFVISPAVVHRDRRYFTEPDMFRPERWLGDLPQQLPRFAYFPFGGGPRICIGNRFAMMEAKLLLAVAIQHCRFALTPQTDVRVLPSVTLRPRNGVHLRVAPRKNELAVAAASPTSM
jgi:cytochrome P450